MKKIILSFLTCCSTFFALYSQTGFPYTNNFFNTNGLTLQMTQGTPHVNSRTGGIDLTESSAENSGFYFTDLSFSTKRGFVLDFVFCIYPSVLNTTNVCTFGNGFSIILFKAGTFSGGQSGSKGSVTPGGLGYPYSFSSAVALQGGYEKGYLGISFDLLGYSKARLTQSQDSSTDSWGPAWRNGIPDLTDDEIKSGSDITIRGPYNPNYAIPVSGSIPKYYGYPVLMSQTLAKLRPNYWEIDGTTGDFVSYTKTMPNFTLGSDAFTNDPNSNNYRRAVLTLYPGYDAVQNAGFYVNLSVYFGSTPVKVVSDFFIDTNSTINYNDIVRQTSGQTSSIDVSKTLSLAPPDNLSLALMGNTAAKTSSVQNISSLNLLLPFAPSLPDESADDICKTKGRSSLFSILDNAVGYNTNVYSPTNPPVGRYTYLDLTSFKFRIYDSVTGNFKDTPSQYECTTSAGKYTYNPNDGTIIFVPSDGAASLTQDFIYYNIKNKKAADPTIIIDSEEYRSRTAKTTINFTDTNCPPIPNRYVKINK